MFHVHDESFVQLLHDMRSVGLLVICGKIVQCKLHADLKQVVGLIYSECSAFYLSDNLKLFSIELKIIL